jgi:hypothetical protein
MRSGGTADHRFSLPGINQRFRLMLGKQSRQESTVMKLSDIIKALCEEAERLIGTQFTPDGLNDQKTRQELENVLHADFMRMVMMTEGYKLEQKQRNLCPGRNMRAFSCAIRPWKNFVDNQLRRIVDTKQKLQRHETEQGHEVNKPTCEMLTEKVITTSFQGKAHEHQEKNSPFNQDAYCLYQDGDFFVVKGFGCSGMLRRLKGMETIARLLARPNTPVLMSELVREPGEDASLPSDFNTSRQEVLDTQALKEFRERLAELTAEIDKAKQERDFAREDAAQSEKEILRLEIKQGTGIGGKPREIDSVLTRLRASIYSRLKTVYKSLESIPHMSELSNHFRESISAEGNSFIYKPSDSTIRWKTEK